MITDIPSHKLVEALHSACAKNKDLKVVVLIDYLRGSRLEKVKTKTSNTTSTASSGILNNTRDALWR